MSFRTRTHFLVVLVLLLAAPVLGLAPGAAAAGGSGSSGTSGKGRTSMPAVSKDAAPTATPQAKPGSGTVQAARTKPTAPVVLTVQAASPTSYGDPVQLTAVVSFAQVPAGGTVTFTDGGVAIGSSAVDATGVAQMSTTELLAGKHSLAAVYTKVTTTASTAALSLIVAKRDLRLYANPTRWSRPVGAANPSYTVAIPEGAESDLVNGDKLATAVSGKPSFSMSAGKNSPPSVYPLTLSGLKSTNYNPVYLPARFTVYSRDLQPGDTAPDFTLPDQDGTTFSLSQLRGRVVLLDFSAVWCGPSAELARDIPAIAAKLAARGVQFSYLPVLVDGATAGEAGTQRDAELYVTRYHLPGGTHVLHADAAPAQLNKPLPAWSDAFHGYSASRDDNKGNLAYPTLALIDADGVVQDITLGYDHDDDALADKLSAIAPDTGVQVTSQPNPVTTRTDATVEFTTTGGVPATCSLDGSAFAPCTSPRSLTGLAPGDHTLLIRAQGYAFPALVSWRIITLDTTITGGPGTGVPAFEFTGTGTGFLCWTGSEEPYPCESGWSVIDIPGGLQTFHVAAVDSFGNVDDTPATQDVVFQPLPTVTLVPDNPDPGPSDAVTWTATVVDATTGDPVTGSVIFIGPDGHQHEVALAADGTASYTESAAGTAYTEYVIYTGDATHGARSGEGSVG